MRKLIALFLSATAALLFVAPADAASRVERTIIRTHNKVCPKVTEYLDCRSVTVEVADFGATGWSASSGPAAGTVKYNTHYSGQPWADVVAHEMGGHHDVWAELVARVGVSQAWTDYYDIDRLAEPWLEAKLGYDTTAFYGKEVVLDCEGPVRHGYVGQYLKWRFGVQATEQPAFCSGYRDIIEAAVG